MEGKSSTALSTPYFPPLPPSDLNTALESCSDNLMKTTLDDFSLLAPPKKDLLSSLNNNIDYISPNFSTCLQSRMSVADCHTPPPLPPLPDCHGPSSTSPTSKLSFMSSSAPYNSQSSPPKNGHSPPDPGSDKHQDQLMSCQQSPTKLSSTSSYSCETPVSILSNFEDSKCVAVAPTFPSQPQYISL